MPERGAAVGAGGATTAGAGAGAGVAVATVGAGGRDGAEEVAEGSGGAGAWELNRGRIPKSTRAIPFNASAAQAIHRHGIRRGRSPTRSR